MLAARGALQRAQRACEDARAARVALVVGPHAYFPEIAHRGDVDLGGGLVVLGEKAGARDCGGVLTDEVAGDDAPGVLGRRRRASALARRPRPTLGGEAGDGREARAASLPARREDHHQAAT